MGESEPLADDSISHGMCRACFEHFDRQWGGQSLGEYLDGLPVPIVAFDGQMRVVAANQAMANRLGKPDRELHGLLGGDVMECAHARLPGGCGNQVCCSTCAIRKTVEEVARTGKGVERVPATLDGEAGSRQVVISAFPREDSVAVVVDDAGED
jgi:PAS domain-containing protein